MTYALSAPLQQAVFARLTSDPALAALVGTAIWDVAPPGELPETYVEIGPETARDASDKSAGGATCQMSILAVSRETGFLNAKTVAGAICDALIGAEMALGRGRLVYFQFRRATARRSADGTEQRVTLDFEARLDDA